jgi:serine/threonine protein phosphatase PrpC
MALIVADAGARTDRGRVRTSNEDALLADAPLFAVADGMGGANAGEIASAMAVGIVHERRGGEGELAGAIEEANARIHDSSLADPSRRGMGTTITSLLLDGDDIVIGHVGDSRAYLYRSGRLQQLTDDHSLVGELVRRGALSPEEAERHPQRSVITRALGAEPTVDIDMLRLAGETGDVLLLASDGLTGMVTDAEIERILANGGELETTANRLVEAANQAGGEDNVTVLLVRLAQTGDSAAHARPPLVIIPDPAEEHTPQSPHEPVPGSRSRRPGTLALGAIGVAGIAAALVIVIALQWAHFVGAQPDGRLAIYQGLPFVLPLDVELYKPVELFDIPVAALTPEQRLDLLDHRIGSRGGSASRVEDLLDRSPWLRPPAG